MDYESNIMNHKELNVWKESMILVRDVYRLLKQFPSEEQFGLCSQMRRSVVSIPSNIAEGCGRNSDKELIRFCYISSGSIAELETQLPISVELQYIDDNHKIFAQLMIVKKLLLGFIRHLQSKNKFAH